MLSEISQAQKDDHCVVMKDLKLSHSQRQRWWFPGAGGGRNGRIFEQVQNQFGSIFKVL
jgi:hypothetical protein